MSTRDELFESSFCNKEKENRVRCTLCYHKCLISEGKSGICGVRKNIEGKLYALNKNLFTALNVDPIEKKPLFHFLPATFSFSVATEGCNFKCNFCQNSDISQIDGEPKGRKITSEKIVEMAIENGCASISYTYTEPTIFFETAFEIGVIARESGLKNVFVTNGYITKEATKRAKNFLDASNVDLKCFSENTYKKIMGATLKGVLEGIDNLLEIGCFVEITTLIIPSMNDSDEELKEIAKFISSRSADIPWHISRFFPHYKMEGIAPTPISTLEKASKIGREEGLKYVYIGNVWGKGENTHCPNCGKLLIERMGFEVLKNLVDNGKCFACGEKINGVFRR